MLSHIWNNHLTPAGKGSSQGGFRLELGKRPSLRYKGCACTLNTWSCFPTCTFPTCIFIPQETICNLILERRPQQEIGTSVCAWNWKKSVNTSLNVMGFSKGWSAQEDCLRLPTRLGVGRYHTSWFCPLWFIVSCQLGCELWSRLSSFSIFICYSYQIAVIFNLFRVWSWFHFAYSSQLLESWDK